MKNRVHKKGGIYFLSIAARQRHRQDGCALEVLGNKDIDKKEDISHEEEENSEILVADSDDIYKLLTNCEFI